MDRHEERAHAAARQATAAQTSNRPLTSYSQIEHSRHRSPVNFVVNVLYCVLPSAKEAVAQSGCLGQLIRTHVTLTSVRIY